MRKKTGRKRGRKEKREGRREVGREKKREGGERALQGAEHDLVPQVHHFLGASALVVASVMASVTHQSEALCPSLPVTGHLGLSHPIVTQMTTG